MTSAELAKGLCDELVHEVAEWNGRSFLVTNFRYPDGDLVSLYLDPDRRKLGDNDPDSLYVSDLGTTIFKCHEIGVEITSPRRRFIDAICDDYGLAYEEGVLVKRLSLKALGKGVLAFCEAVTRISALNYDRQPRRESTVPELVNDWLVRFVQPYRTIDRGWHDPVLDPSGIHPVDYKVNGKGDPRFIFTVTSEDKCTVVDAVSHFYRSNKVWVQTLAVVDPLVKIGGTAYDRLKSATDKIFEGVEDNRRLLVDFALSGQQLNA